MVHTRRVQHLHGVANGSHTITVRNASGCTTTGSIFSVSCGCVNGPALALTGISGSTCGTAPVTVSGNTFGNATTVTISGNGAGSISPSSTVTSPFAFTYTPAAGDAGNTVTITFTTDNPLGSPCAAATATYTLTVNAVPAAPGVTVVDNCDGTSTLTATGVTGTLLWSNASTANPVTVNTPGTNTVTQTLNGCTSPAGSGTAAPKTAPAAPGVTVVNNCDGTSTLTATGVTGTLLWSNASTANPVTVNTAGTYTVTQTLNGCTSPAGSGTAAPKTAPATPSQTIDCSLGVGNASVTVTSPTGAGIEYSLDGGPYQTG